MAKSAFFDELFQDVRYAARTFRRSPGFAATAVVALALGIGANTAVFSVVNKVLLQPLNYPEPDRLVALELSSPQGNANITSIPKFIAWKQLTKVFESVAAYDLGGPGVNLTGGDRPEQLKGLHVSADYFTLFGGTTIYGRPFTPDEDRPGGPDVAVITNGLWHSHFGADPALIGNTILLGGQPYVVTGVLRPGYSSDPPADIYLPLRADPNSTDQAHYLRAAARLRPGVTLGMAQAAMKLSAEEYEKKFPNSIGPNSSFTAEPLRDSVVGDVRKALLVLLGAVGLVLLIACANVANLMLARATVRQREIAIRAAIGAGRRRIIRQLLTEAILLSLVGGVFGLIVGFGGVRALLAINPGNIPRIGEAGAEVGLDWSILLFTLVISIATGVLFGSIPAFTASRADLNSTLKESGSRSGGSTHHHRVRSVLVITEMSLAIVLLVGAALLIRTFMALRTVDPGFNTHNVLVMEMSLTGPRFEKTAGIAQLVLEAQRRVESLPGVESLASTCCLPLEGGFGLPFVIEGRPLTNGPYHGGASWRTISPEYFKVFRIPLIRGRLFNDRDDANAARVVLVNEGFAKQYWKDADPVGQQIIIGKGVGPEFEEPARQIIGVVGDVRDNGLNNNPDPIMYVPVSQVPDGVAALNNRIIPITWAIRTKVAPFSLSGDIQKELRAASGGLPVGHIRSMDQVRGQSTALTDFNMTLLTAFSGIALALAAVGIYGLMAYSVQQRIQETGIRMALGASPREVVQMVVWQGMRLALAGVILGVGIAFGVSRVMSSLLFGVKPRDPVAFVVVVIALSLVALIATYVPALRASRVDPIAALRYE